MRKWIGFIFIFIFFLSPVCHAAGKALVLEINGPIGPATQDYIERGISNADKTQAALIVIKLDTPGGLESAMRGIINESILKSHIPIVTFVTPAGARAASAGTYIVFASHIAAMSGGTNIGSATPVSLLPSEKKDTTLSTSEIKEMNDAAAYLKSLANLRGRNATWAEVAVTKGANITAEEALQLKVIDVIAKDLPELFQKINGHSVPILGENKIINTKDIQIETMSPDWHYQFLSFLTNPNIAYILMLIAMYGLFFEFSNPGLVLPGVAGIIALFLMLYAFQLMPVNYVGFALIMIGVAFMVFEVYVSSFGALGIGGVIAFIIGSLMLFDWHDPNFRVAWPLIAAMSLVSIIFFFVIVNVAFRSHKKAIVTGREGLIGSTGTVINVMPDKILVHVWGEIWEAHSSHKLHPGQLVKIINVDGLMLTVVPHEKKH